jgi:hypothetical protein
VAVAGPEQTDSPGSPHPQTEDNAVAVAPESSKHS